MEVKLFEVRDEGTCIPVMAIKLAARKEAERYLLARSGYGTRYVDQHDYVIVARLAGGSGDSHCDPYDWGNRTMTAAHAHIKNDWPVLASGAVIDVEYIMGITKTPKVSEAVNE